MSMKGETTGSKNILCSGELSVLYIRGTTTIIGYFLMLIKNLDALCRMNFGKFCHNGGIVDPDFGGG